MCKYVMVDWLYLDLNSFFASCEQQNNPQWRGRPLAVVPTNSDSTSCIAASYQAKKFGVKTGTRVGDAKKMCPGLICVPASHHLYVQYHHRIIEIVESCVPIHAVCSIDEIACQLTGSQKDITVAKTLALKIKKEIATHLGSCMTLSIGLSSNMLLSKMAADMQKPDGLTVIEKSSLPQALHALKLQDIPGIGPRMDRRLQQMGVHTMEQLLQLQEPQMRAAWGGIVGAKYYYLLKGEHIESKVSADSKSISHQHVMPPNLRNFAGAYNVAQKLIVKAALRMRKEKMMCKKISFFIKYTNGQYWEHHARLSETQDTSIMLQKLKEFYAFSPRKPTPIKVTIWLSDFVPETQHQLSFFENEKRNTVFQAVDAINQKYGRDTVYVGSLHNHRSTAPTRIAFSRIPEIDEVD